MKYIIRYEVHLSLGDGGSRTGIFKTLEEAKQSLTRKDQTIWRSYFKRMESGKLFRLDSEKVC